MAGTREFIDQKDELLQKSKIKNLMTSGSEQMKQFDQMPTSLSTLVSVSMETERSLLEKCMIWK